MTAHLYSGAPPVVAALVAHDGRLDVVRRATDAEARAGLLHVARILGRVGPIGVERLVSVAHDGPTTTLCTGFAGGCTLDDTPPWSPEALAEVTATVLRTLGRLHRLGVVHGAPAPRSIVLGPDRTPVLCGFENARERTDESDDAWARSCAADVRAVGRTLEQLVRSAPVATTRHPLVALHRHRVLRSARSVAENIDGNAYRAAILLDRLAGAKRATVAPVPHRRRVVALMVAVLGVGTGIGASATNHWTRTIPVRPVPTAPPGQS